MKEEKIEKKDSYSSGAGGNCGSKEGKARQEKSEK